MDLDPNDAPWHGLGSFRHNVSPQVYSEIDIVTTPGTAFAGAQYGDPLAGFDSNDLLVAVPDASLPDLTGEPTIGMKFSRILRRAGGAADIDGPASDESTCANANCGNFAVQRRPASGRIAAPVFRSL